MFIQIFAMKSASYTYFLSPLRCISLYIICNLTKDFCRFIHIYIFLLRKFWHIWFYGQRFSFQPTLDTFSLHSLERYTVPRSPDENDRSELLRQAEPIDYQEDDEDGLFGNVSGSNSYRPGSVRGSDSTGYQGRPSRFESNRSGKKPPRGIFDDVWSNSIALMSPWFFYVIYIINLNKSLWL